MKKLILISAILTYAFVANGQGSRLSIAGFGGASFPTGRFSSTNSYKQSPAYAKTGFSFNAEINYRLLKKSGILVQYGFQQNAVNTKAMDYVYALPSPSAAGYTATVQSEPWEMHSVLLGLYHQLKLKDPFYLDIAIKAGQLKTAYPEMKEQNKRYETAYSTSGGIGYDTTYTFITRYRIPGEWGWKYSAAAKLKYQVSNKILLLAVLDYFYSNPKLAASSTIEVRSFVGSSWGRTPESSSTVNASGLPPRQKISALNLSLGLQLNFTH